MKRKTRYTVEIRETKIYRIDVIANSNDSRKVGRANAKYEALKVFNMGKLWQFFFDAERTEKVIKVRDQIS